MDLSKNATFLKTIISSYFTLELIIRPHLQGEEGFDGHEVFGLW
jgi:hypothetical protein